MILEIGKFLEFSKLKIFGIFCIENFWEFCKFKFFGILIVFQIVKFENLLIFENKPFQKFYYFRNLSKKI